MSNHEDIEIGWKKELLEDSKEENRSSTSRRRNRSPGKKKKYHRLSSRSSSSSSSTSTSSSSSDDRKKKKDEKNERRQKRKEEKELKKEKRRQEKAEKKLLKQAKKEQRKEEKKMKKLAKKLKGSSGKDSDGEDCAIPIDLMYNKSHAPETQQEYEARQSQIRRIVDPDTGRTRLIKGDGEILEEIVSKDRHKEINKQATRGDGNFFQSKTVGWKISN